MNGTPRQTFAKMTLQRAFHVSPRKLMLPSIHPSCRRDQEMTENCGSKIHQKAMAESTVGTMKGIRITARMIALNGMCWLRSSARYKPIANLNALATNV